MHRTTREVGRTGFTWVAVASGTMFLKIEPIPVPFVSNRTAIPVMILTSARRTLISVVSNKAAKTMTEATIAAVKQATIKLMMALVAISTSVLLLTMAVR